MDRCLNSSKHTDRIWLSLTSYLRRKSMAPEGRASRIRERKKLEEEVDNVWTVNGKSNLNVIGVGSGTGEVDLRIFSGLHQKYPEMTVDNVVIEPTPQQLNNYKDLVSQSPGLDYIKFNWNKMTAEEFEKQWKEKKMTEKADLILMFEMLYFVKDPGATVNFFHSLLKKNGQLLITLVSEKSSVVKIQNDFCDHPEVRRSTANIKPFLDSKGLSYRCYELPAQLDITKCFIEGDEEGEMMIDFLTQVLHFSKTASPKQRAGFMEFLRSPEVSVKSNGKVFMISKHEVVVLIKTDNK
ncbi:histamine N-methyltransferase-like [Antennarius striatus]|uniref:histamine N-methyltransferase-like n=1 Tax=Antennarius striatus TaxID=241820 RepID=UPI0035B1CF3E